MCDSGDFGQLRATVGNFDIGEGQTNVIPHHAELTVDLRNPVDDLMTAAEQHLAAYVDALDASNPCPGRSRLGGRSRPAAAAREARSRRRFSCVLRSVVGDSCDTRRVARHFEPAVRR